MLMGIFVKVLFVTIIAITIIVFAWKEITTILPVKVVSLCKDSRCAIKCYSRYSIILIVI